MQIIRVNKCEIDAFFSPIVILQMKSFPPHETNVVKKFDICKCFNTFNIC